ncbi:condensation domain-containing protein [Vibrio vulnificus]|uniref:condensation domain-containing protein n=1 Tax=Vibrio vulnificus TaxID=672 RepID=UPI00165DCACA|nr:condensation domain-containing protein [Vibrio vulnificus]
MALTALDIEAKLPLTPNQIGGLATEDEDGSAFLTFAQVNFVGEKWCELNMQRALNTLVVHHDALRVQEYCQEGKLGQRLMTHGAAAVEYVDCRGVSVLSMTSELQLAFQRTQKHINEKCPCLLSLLVVQLSDDELHGLIVVHHSMGDGFSMQFFAQQLEELYQGNRTLLDNDRSLSYREYCERLQAYAKSEQVAVVLERLSRNDAYNRQIPLIICDAPDEDFIGRDSVKEGVTISRPELRNVSVQQVEQAVLRAVALTCLESEQNELQLDYVVNGRAVQFAEGELDGTMGWLSHHAFLLLSKARLKSQNWQQWLAGEVALAKSDSIATQILQHGKYYGLEGGNALAVPKVVVNLNVQRGLTLEKNVFSSLFDHTTGFGDTVKKPFSLYFIVNFAPDMERLELFMEYSHRQFESKTVQKLLAQLKLHLEDAFVDLLERNGHLLMSRPV